ncbi:Hid1 [Symbiodinium sp. CCMP2456]|nr:Hid1 [Symbiodinium sp. CCMP2456]
MGAKAAKAKSVPGGPLADLPSEAASVQAAPPIRSLRGAEQREYTQEQEAAAAKIGAVARGSATRWQVKQDYHEAKRTVEGDPLEPPLLGFADYAQRNSSMPSVPDSIRFKVRDVTKRNVLKQLGHTEGVSHWNTFEALASRLLEKVSGSGGESLPPGPKKQMSMAHLFNDEEALRAELETKAAEGFVARRQDHYLLGKYQMVAVPAMADYDSAFGEVRPGPQEGLQAASPHQSWDCDGPEGFDGWFWVLHAAAPNIGESAQAEDFLAYSVEEEDVDESSPARTESVRSTVSTASRCCWKDRLVRPTRRLNEDLYIQDLRHLWRNVLTAMRHLQVEDVILFPFGMGAFLRHLNLNDDRYEDASSMRRLKRRIADELMHAIVDICSPKSRAAPKASAPFETRVHLCLVCVNPESVDNHNCFVEAAAARAKGCPELKEILHLRRNVDSLQLAHELAKKSGSGKLKVALLNGANRKLCGNHWFQSGARYAIDENLHRRSASLSRASLLVNFDTEPRPRRTTQLQETVKFFSGTVVNLAKKMEPEKVSAVQKQEVKPKSAPPSKAKAAKAPDRRPFCLCGRAKPQERAEEQPEMVTGTV